MPTKKKLEDRMMYRITRSVVPVFVASDFKDLSGGDQIGRVLRRITKSGFLIRIGRGIYARSKISPLTGKPTLEWPIQELAKAALVKLGVTITQSRCEKAYNEGRTSQVPTGRVIGVKSRVSRKIGYNGNFVTFEQSA